MENNIVKEEKEIATKKEDFYNIAKINKDLVPPPSTKQMYQQWDEQLMTSRFDASLWHRYFKEYTKPECVNRQGIRMLRILIIRSTLAIWSNTAPKYRKLKNTKKDLYPPLPELPASEVKPKNPYEDDWKCYLSEDEVLVFNKDFVLEQLKNSMHYASDFVSTIKPPECQTQILVMQGDCLEAALWVKNVKNTTPVVLNMANRFTPGGGYLDGAGAQEENLHRRSNLHMYLDDPHHVYPEREWGYPINEFGAIYAKNVVFFRSSEANGYGLMRKPELISVIASAADSKPKTFKREGKERLQPEYEERAIRKMKAIFEVAKERGHDALVLSALGCGAFRNPPLHIAQLFQQVIKENSYDKQFKYIIFAVIDDHNAHKSHNPDGNYLPFVNTFGKECEAILDYKYE